MIEQLKQLIKDQTVYEFLQIEKDDSYHDAKGFIDIIENEFKQLFKTELYQAMDLVNEQHQINLFKSYIHHVIAYVKNEKVLNPVTQQYDEPDRQLMESVESHLDIKIKLDEYRQGLLGQIASFKIEHPNSPLIVEQVLSYAFIKLKSSYYKQHQNEVSQICQDLLIPREDRVSILNEKRLSQVNSTLKNLQDRFGYCETCALSSLSLLDLSHL